MAKIIRTELGYNDHTQKWSVLSKNHFYEDKTKVINDLRQEYGDDIWNYINPISPTSTVILLPHFRDLEKRKVEVVIDD